MSSLRPLLRLDDKVSSETRRLAQLGEPPPRRAAAVAWTLAIGAHAALLALPLIGAGQDLPSRTPPPDLPTVWRLLPSRPLEPVVSFRAASRPATAVPAVSATVAAPVGFDAEPIPEPAPALSYRPIPADVETIIPEPDLSSRGFEAALVPRAAAPVEPKVLRKVRPTYPAAARAISATGTVTLEVWVREDGSVDFARVLTCSRSKLGFEQSALSAVREFTYDTAPPGTGPRQATVLVEFGEEARP